MQYKPIHAELKKLKNGWTNKRDKYEEAHRAELTLWNAASRYLHANLTDTKTLPISKWKHEYADLNEQRDRLHQTESCPRRSCRASEDTQMRGYCAESRAAGADTEPHQAAGTGEIKKRTGKLFCLSVLNVF